MNKKGFTLIEIIICIAIIAVIGTVSIIGFNIAFKNIRINKLKDIEDEIMTAAKIYLETNDTARTQLYTKDNAVVVPLNVLVNEGLLDLSMTDLDEDDIDGEYVLTGTTTQTDSNGCVNITSTASWNMSDENPLYICTKSDGSITLSGDAGVSDNLGAVKRDVEYLYNSIYKYAYYNDINTLYMIYYIDTDDSIVLVKNGSFNNVFNGKYKTFHNMGKAPSSGSCDGGIPHGTSWTNVEQLENGEAYLNDLDLKMLFYCQSMHSMYSYVFINNFFTNNYNPAAEADVTATRVLIGSYVKNLDNYRKIKLKPCMKITDGNGLVYNPYKIEDKC